MRQPSANTSKGSFAERRQPAPASGSRRPELLACRPQRLAGVALCDARLALLLANALLPSVRRHVERLLYWPACQNRPAVIAVLFATQQTLDHETLGTLRPLFQSAHGFCDAPDIPASKDCLRLWWQGQPHDFDMQQAERLSLSLLWPLGSVERHDSKTLPSLTGDRGRRTPKASPIQARDPALAALGGAQHLDALAREPEKGEGRAWFRVAWGIADTFRSTRRVVREGFGLIWTLLLLAAHAVVFLLVCFVAYSALRPAFVAPSFWRPWPILLTVIFSIIVGAILLVLLLRVLGLVLGSGDDQEEVEAGKPRYTVSILQRFRSWFSAYTPLGDDVRRAYAKRLDEVQKLLSQGKIDEALLRALAVAQKHSDKGGLKRFFPTKGPGVRGQLDFEVETSDFVSPVLAPGAPQFLRTEYSKLAKTLEGQGDFRRAAYVYSKLMGDHFHGIEALVKAGMALEAAEVSLQSEQPPSRTICLYYATGKKELALALAKRYGDFQELADQSGKSDPEFYALVVHTWCQDLMRSGRWLDALEASEPLATDLAREPQNLNPLHPLLAMRRDCLTDALAEHRQGETMPARLLVRGLLMLPWQAEDWPMDWLSSRLSGEAEPSPMHTAKQSVQAALAASLAPAQVAGQSDAAAHPDRQPTNSAAAHDKEQEAILETLSALAQNDSLEQDCFCQHASETFLDSYTRYLLAVLGAQGRFDSKMQAKIRDLLQQFGLRVLHEDVAKLTSISQAPTHAKVCQNLQLPTAPPVGDPCMLACPLEGQKLAIWRQSGKLEIFDKSGKLLASHWMSHLLDLICVPGSQTMLVLQKAGALTRIMSLGLHSNQVRELAIADLRYWSSNLSKRHWYVQLGPSVTALSLPDLLRPDAPGQVTSRLVPDWQVQIGDTLRTLAIADMMDGEISWLTVDDRQTRYGLIEHWSFEATFGKLQTRLCEPSKDTKPSDTWIWYGNHSVLSLTEDGTWESVLDFKRFDARKASALVRRIDRRGQNYLPRFLIETPAEFAPAVRFLGNNSNTAQISEYLNGREAAFSLDSSTPLYFVTSRHQPEPCAVLANKQGQVAAVWLNSATSLLV